MDKFKRILSVGMNIMVIPMLNSKKFTSCEIITEMPTSVNDKYDFGENSRKACQFELKFL